MEHASKALTCFHGRSYLADVLCIWHNELLLRLWHWAGRREEGQRAGSGGGVEASERLLSVMLTEMDGLEQCTGGYRHACLAADPCLAAALSWPTFVMCMQAELCCLVSYCPPKTTYRIADRCNHDGHGLI